MLFKNAHIFFLSLSFRCSRIVTYIRVSTKSSTFSSSYIHKTKSKNTKHEYLWALCIFRQFFSVLMRLWSRPDLCFVRTGLCLTFFTPNINNPISKLQELCSGIYTYRSKLPSLPLGWRGEFPFLLVKVLLQQINVPQHRPTKWR